jgi:hypothetical protein
VRLPVPVIMLKTPLTGEDDSLPWMTCAIAFENARVSLINSSSHRLVRHRCRKLAFHFCGTSSNESAILSSLPPGSMRRF